MRLTRTPGIALALALSAAFLSAQAASTDKKPADDKSKAAPAAAPDEKAMMEAMDKAAAPGEQHKKLAAMAGTWDLNVKMFMKPGDPPQESTGTATRTSVLGGRYLEEKVEGTMMGKPFSGQGLTGYDNVTKKYVGTWSDTAGTGILTTTGTMDKGGKSVTFKGSMVDPMTGKASPFREKFTMTDDDHQTFEMWGPGQDGKNYKMMEIKYTRKK